MEQVIVNEDGELIWGNPTLRLIEIQERIKPRIEEFARNKRADMMKMKPMNINYIPQINNLLDAFLRKKPLLRYDYAIAIPAEVLQDYADKFFDLLIFIREEFPEYIANKQIFCAFCSMSTMAFNQLANSNNGDIVAIIENITDSCQDTSMTGAMGGAVNTAATFNRMKAKGAGYDMQIQNDSESKSQTTIILDNDVVRRKLGNLGFGQIENKK